VNEKDLIDQLTSASKNAPNSAGMIRDISAGFQDFANNALRTEGLTLLKSAVEKIQIDPSQAGQVLSSTLSAFKTKLGEIVSKSLGDVIKNSGLGNNSLYDDLTDIGKEMAALANMATDLATDPTKATAFFSGVSKGAGDSAEALKGMVKTFGEIKVLDVVGDLATSADKFEQALISPFTAYQKQAAEFARKKGNVFSDLLGRGPGDQTEADIDGFRDQIMASMKDLQINLRMSPDEANASVKAVLSEFTNLKAQVGDGMALNIDGKPVLDSIGSMTLIAKQFGVTVGEVASHINTLTGMWGVTGEEAQSSLLSIGKAAAMSGIPAAEMFEKVTNLNKAFEHTGDATAGLTAMMAQFATAMPQRLGMAIVAAEKLGKGIATMSDEMKGFLGMGSQALGGGGNAIEAIVRMEAAMASGDQDKIREIQDEMAQKIEELSGSAMLTQQEAVDTGQEEKFYMQSKLAEQMGMSQGRTGYSAMVEGMRGTTDVGSLNAAPGDMVDILRGGQKMANQTMTVAELLKSQTEGRRTEASRGYAQQIMPGAENLRGEGLEITQAALGNQDGTGAGIGSLLRNLRNQLSGIPVRNNEADLDITHVSHAISSETQGSQLANLSLGETEGSLSNTAGGAVLSSSTQAIQLAGIAQVETMTSLTDTMQAHGVLTETSLKANTEAMSALTAVLSSGEGKNINITVSATPGAGNEELAKAIKRALGDPASW
jgi:hypothetical protein